MALNCAALWISLNPTLLLLQTLHIAVVERAERTLVRVVWSLGSLRLLELSWITQTMPVGCTPFLSSLHSFLPLSNCPLFSFSCFFSQAHSNCFSVYHITAFLLHLMISHLFQPSLAFSCTSVCLSRSLALSEVPLGRADFAGLPKGAQGRGNFLQHMLVRCGAEQEVCKDDAEGKEEAVEETERERECKVHYFIFK